MNVGLYGGSFNPIHHGHLLTARWASEKRELDKIILMPCFISPLRQTTVMVNGAQRLKMVELAIQNDNLFEVSDYELKQEGISYTINTIRKLIKQYDSVELIIGFDNYVVFDKWQSPDEILNLVNVVVLHREMKIDDIISHNYGDGMIFLKTPAIEISSTDIRARVQKNKPIDYLTTQPVIEYIKNNNFYR